MDFDAPGLSNGTPLLIKLGSGSGAIAITAVRPKDNAACCGADHMHRYHATVHSSENTKRRILVSTEIEHKRPHPSSGRAHVVSDKVRLYPQTNEE